MAVKLSSLLLDADLFLISPRQLTSLPNDKTSFHAMWNIFFYNAGEDSSRRSCEQLLMSTLLLSDLITSLSVNWRPRQLLI